MTDLINWVIPKEFWELYDPDIIEKYHEMLDIVLKRTTVPFAGQEESLKKHISKIIDQQKVDVSDLTTYWERPCTRITPDINKDSEMIKDLNIDINELFGKMFLSPHEKSYEKIYHGCKASELTVLCIDNKIKDLLGPDATFKIKVRGSYRYHEKGGKIYHDWAVSVTTLISSDDLILMKLSMD